MEMDDLSSREPEDGERWGRSEERDGEEEEEEEEGNGSNSKGTRELYKDQFQEGGEEEEQFVIDQGQEDDSDQDIQDDISWEKQ